MSNASITLERVQRLQKVANMSCNVGVVEIAELI